MPADISQPTLFNLLTSPVFMVDLAIVVGGGCLILYAVMGKEFPHIRGKHKDTEFEITPPNSEISVSAEAPSAQTGPPEAGEETSSTDSTPQSAPEIELLVKLMEKRSAGASAIRSEWSSMAADVARLPDDERQFLTVVQATYRVQLGDDTAISDMATIASQNPSWRRPVLFLANHYVAVGSLAEAERWATEGMRRAQLAKEHSDTFVVRLDIELRRSSFHEALTLARQLLTNAPTAETRARILIALAENRVTAKEYEQAAIFFQAAMEETPDNSSDRFSFAYKMNDNQEHNLLTYAQYRRLERASPDKSFVLNNMAVVCSNLGESGLYGHYLERAVGVDKAWATANLAIKLAEIGFLGEAQKRIGELTPEEKDNERVSAALDYFSRTRTKRDEAQQSLDKRSENFSTFFSESAKAFMRGEVPELRPGEWVTEDRAMSIQIVSLAEVRLVRGSTICTGSVRGRAQHFFGEVKSKNETLLTKTSFSIRLLPTGNRLGALVERLDYSGDKTTDAEFAWLAPASSEAKPPPPPALPSPP